MNDHELLQKKALRRFLAFLSLCTGLMVAVGFVGVFVYGETGIALPLVLAVSSTVGLMVMSYIRWDDWFPHERGSQTRSFTRCYTTVGCFGPGAIFGFPDGTK